MVCSVIQRNENARILGHAVIISSHLTWNDHVDNILSKASKPIYMFYLKRGRCWTPLSVQEERHIKYEDFDNFDQIL